MSLFASQQGQTNAPINYVGLNVSAAQWNAPRPIFWGERRLSLNAVDFVDFKAHPVSGKGKGGGGKTDQQQTYTAAVVMGLCEGPIDSIANIWQNGSTTTTSTLSQLNMTSFSGTLSQAPWSFLTTNFPTHALAYSQLSYIAGPNVNLGESATIPDIGFECIRTNGFSFSHVSTTSGWINPNNHVQASGTDVMISDVITDLLTNVQYGMGFSVADIGSITQYAAYQRAQGLFFSPLLNSQEKCSSIIDRWAQFSNSWIYWSGSALQFVPLGDSPVTGNGVTYTPDLAVAYNLTTCDFLAASGKDDGPVKVTRIDPADAHNRLVLNYLDRTLAYIDNPVEWKDDGLVSRYGLRDDSSTQADEICDPAVAQIVVQLMGKRGAYIRKTYEFKTSYRFILCIPGSILTLTDSTSGLDLEIVRVVKVEEDANDQLSFTCEEFPGTIGTYYPPGAAPAITTASTPVTNIAPGAVNTPAIIEPDSAFTGAIPQVIIAASGGVNWGGCIVNISFDGVEYSSIGTINAPAAQGLLTAALAAPTGGNPDTVHTLSVDCTESQTLPAPVTNADAAALRTLSLVCAQPTVSGGAAIIPTNGELLAFGAVAATATFAANLTYLERGAYGTTGSAHNIGDQFTLIDITGTAGTSVAFDLPAQYIGQPIFVKLQSFNIFSQALQDISTVVEYRYTPTGAGFGTAAVGAPQTPTGLATVSGAGQISVSWIANAATDNVTSYALFAAAGLGASFGSASLIFSGDVTHFVHSGLGNSQSCTYFVEATNAVGTSGVSAGVNGTTATTGAGVLGSQTANTVMAGPASGAAAVPAFRALVAADIPVGVGVSNVSGGVTEPLPTAAPSSYPLGVSIRRALGSSGWPLDGFVLTLFAVDGNAPMQVNWPFNQAVTLGQMRTYDQTTATWNAWSSIAGGVNQLTSSVSVSAALSTFSAGISIGRAVGSSGWPVDGYVMTVREGGDTNIDGYQWVWAFSTDMPAQVRLYNGSTLSWGSFHALGTVTSVALTAPSILSVTGSPVTSAGTLALGLSSQAAGTIWAGPVSGSAAAPTFRALSSGDIPSLSASYLATGTFSTSGGSLLAPVSTVAGLPSAASEGAGARRAVTDALAPSIGVAVVGGGGVFCAVISNGTTWVA